MKARITFLLVLFIVALFNANAEEPTWPTTIVKVAPDVGVSKGALQDAVAANGSAIYELKRGGEYFTNGQWTMPSDVVVIIRAEDGTGPRPLIMYGTPSSGGGSGDNVLRINASSKWENIYFTGLDDAGITHKNQIRVNKGTYFEFENCFFDYDNAACIRNETSNSLYKFDLCTFRNAVQYDGIANGRGIDLRDQKKVGIIMTHCTFYSLSSQLIRPGSTTIDSMIFKNNTVYNVVNELALASSLKAVVQNNIFYNVGVNGAATNTSGIITIDSLTTPENEPSRHFDIRNNLIYRSSEFLALSNPPTCERFQRNLLNSIAHRFIEAGQVTVSDTLTNGPIAFKNAPKSIVEFSKYFWENCFPSGWIGASPTEAQNLERYEDPFPGDVDESIAFDFGYSESSPFYTAGLDGKPLGSHQYFKNITGIDYNTELRNVLTFFNAASKNIIIKSVSSEVASLTLHIYSTNGALTASHVVPSNGQNVTHIDISSLASGSYVYVVEYTLRDGKRGTTRGKSIL